MNLGEYLRLDLVIEWLRDRAGACGGPGRAGGHRLRERVLRIAAAADAARSAAVLTEAAVDGTCAAAG